MNEMQRRKLSKIIIHMEKVLRKRIYPEVICTENNEYCTVTITFGMGELG